jgi:hypothetical protein
LVEEDVFAVAAFGREVLEVAVLVDAVFEAELLPELRADWQGLVWRGVVVVGERVVVLTAVAALPGLERDDFTGRIRRDQSLLYSKTYRGML